MTATQNRSRLRQFVAATAIATTSAAMFVGVAPSVNAQTACVDSNSVADAAEGQFFQKLNAKRAEQGKAALTWNQALSENGVTWSKTMSAEDRLYHDPNYVTTTAALVPNWAGMGENVGVSSMYSKCTTTELQSATTRAVEGLHNAFVNSPGHYANMIGNFNQTGIGVYFDNDQIWVTVRFVNGPTPNNTPPSPNYTTSTPTPPPPVSTMTEAANFINAAYNTFLNRNATATEINNWTPTVQSGDRKQLTNALAYSNEWAGVEIEALYQKVLGRASDPGGKAHWLNLMRNGMRLETVAAHFYASPEYFQQNGSSNEGYITGLYVDILHRNPDPGGFDHWMAHMGYGANRNQVATSFYASIESRRDRVQGLYQEILNRNPDPGGWDHWSQVLVTRDDVQLAAFLAASAEFYNNSQK